MYNNSCVVLVSKEVEELETEEETYNFEVEDNHNYFVGESLILVHNDCENVKTEDGKDLYRGGNKTIPRSQEIILDKSKNVKPKEGISVNTDINKVKNFGAPHKVVSIPDGLQVVQKGVEGHYIITAGRQMKADEFIELCKLIKLEKVII